MAYTLRDYQVRAVEGSRNHFREGKRSVLIVSPTGSGKTVIASHIIEQAVNRGSRTLALAHRKELIDQLSAKLDENGVPHGIIKAGNNRIDPTAPVQVASKDTLVRRLERMRQEFDLIITDEAHHSIADTYRKIYDRWPKARHLGLTATPYRADGKGLGDIFDSMIEVDTVDNLIAAGYLVRSRVFAGRKVDLTGIKTVAGEYNLGQLGEAVNKPKIIGDIVKNWKKFAPDRQTLCFTVNIEHSKTVRQAFVDEGIKAEHLDGTTPDDERAAILTRFAAGFTQVICNCCVLTEGWDCPIASAIILARPTKSRGLWRQMIGRCLRPFKDKVDCLILDHGNCTDTHGFITDPDRFDLTSGAAKDKPKANRRCRACGAEYAGTPTFCPVCGALLKDGESRLDDKINYLGDRNYELEEITRRGRRKHSDPAVTEILFFKDLIKAQAMNYKPGWAAMRYKNRTGQYPADELWDKSRVRTVKGPDFRRLFI